MISHKSTIRKDAIPQSRGLYHVDVSDIRVLARRATGVLRGIRSVIVKEQEPNLFSKELIYDTLTTEKLTYRDIEVLLKSKSLDELDHFD